VLRERVGGAGFCAVQLRKELLLLRRVASVLVVLGVAALIAVAQPQPTTQPVQPADNSYCLTCHVNFQREKLAVHHQKAGVGCTNCHGASDKHSSDEDGVIPPDIMFAKDRITSTCANCHKTDVLEKDGAHAPLLTGKSAEPLKYCTDCHGKHQMAHRTRKWDKVTRKLISDDGVRMLNQAELKK
jgi:hypothetical protein